MARVFVAMSGGVDSSVSAALLLEQGHDVTGVTMQLWPSGDTEGGCCSVSAVRDARRVCDLLGIAHYTLNFRDAFDTRVVADFAAEYARGRTPNPCIVCNDRLKFSDLLARVSAQGAEYLATGHYARIARDDAGRPRLARGVDSAKDQSYFLYRLTQSQLEHVMFPLGELKKPVVRAIAERMGLHIAQKPDSQEVCFAPAGQHTQVVASRRPEALVPGDIVNASGEVLGHHSGIAGYTVGQRRGLGIASAGPLHVLAIDATSNRIVVGGYEDLAVVRVEAGDIVWSGAAHESVRAMVRYRMQPQDASARMAQDRLDVTFAQPIFGVSPGQAVVCYQGDLVIGGGGDYVRELIDCHIHTERCGHAVGTVEDYVRAAVGRGLVGMAMTEHLPLPDGMDPESRVSMPACDLENYLVEVDLIRDRYPEIEIVTGVEADYLPRRMDEVRKTIDDATKRSDGARIVLGSVHLLGDWTFDDPHSIDLWESRNVDAVWEEYFATWCDACRTGLFDVMAHADLVKKFGHRPAFDARELYAEAARVAAESGVLVEVSTAGLRKPVGELYPGRDLLAAFCTAGVRATVGSDAHAPAEVGMQIELAYEAMHVAGYRSVAFPRASEGWRSIPL